MQAYSEKLGIFFRTVQAKLDSLAALKITSRSGIGIKANANTAELVRELDKIKKTISKTDYALKFGAALHNEAEKVMEQKLAAINTRITASNDYRAIESLLAEIKRVKVDYCNASSPHYIGLLLEQRSILEKDITAIVTAADLAQRIDCATLGCIYFPALSYENAYLNILDHLNHMFLLLSLFPGND